MVLKLNTYDSFFTSAPFKFYAVEENDNPDIEEILEKNLILMIQNHMI